jgi:cell division protein FtsL
MSEFTPASILSFGTIGLGFLLAFMAYQLLSKPDPKTGSVYVFMFFCVVLVVIGAVIQIYQIRNSVGDKDKEITRMRDDFNARFHQIDLRIGDAVAQTRSAIEVLGQSNALATGAICPGGSNGRPAAQAGQIAQLNASISSGLGSVLTNLSAVKDKLIP